MKYAITFVVFVVRFWEFGEECAVEAHIAVWKMGSRVKELIIQTVFYASSCFLSPQNSSGLRIHLSKN